MKIQILKSRQLLLGIAWVLAFNVIVGNAIAQHLEPQEVEAFKLKAKNIRFSLTNHTSDTLLLPLIFLGSSSNLITPNTYEIISDSLTIDFRTEGFVSSSKPSTRWSIDGTIRAESWLPGYTKPFRVKKQTETTVKWVIVLFDDRRLVYKVPD